MFHTVGNVLSRVSCPKGPHNGRDAAELRERGNGSRSLRINGCMAKKNRMSWRIYCRDCEKHHFEWKTYILSTKTATHSRPLEEPPILPWRTILRHYYSDTRLLALFPKNPENRDAAKDLWDEMIAIVEYKKWLSARQAMALAGGNMEREEFFDNLECEVDMDCCIVEAQFQQLAQTAPAIGQFEFLWLDSDGGTISMAKEFRRGHDILEGVPEDERGKYELLRSQCRDPVAAFEYGGSTHWGRSDPEWLLQLIQGGHNIIEDRRRR